MEEKNAREKEAALEALASAKASCRRARPAYCAKKQGGEEE